MLTWNRYSPTRWYASNDATEFAAEVDLDTDGWHATQTWAPPNGGVYGGVYGNRGVHADLGDAMRACDVTK